MGKAVPFDAETFQNFQQNILAKWKVPQGIPKECKDVLFVSKTFSYQLKNCHDL